MITQAIMDFIRDMVVNWISGVNDLSSGVDVLAAGSSIGGVSGQAGHFLALFISPGVWPVIVSAWGVWMAVWLATGLIAIFSRRGKSA